MDDIETLREILEKNLEKWLEKHDPSDYVRIDDTYNHETIEYDEKTLEFSTGLYSLHSWTNGYSKIYKFPNEQDFANRDSSGIESLKIHLPTLSDSIRKKIDENTPEGGRISGEYLYFDESNLIESYNTWVESLPEDDRYDIECGTEKYIDIQWVEEEYNFPYLIRQALCEHIEELKKEKKARLKPLTKEEMEKRASENLKKKGGEK